MQSVVPQQPPGGNDLTNHIEAISKCLEHCLKIADVFQASDETHCFKYNQSALARHFPSSASSASGPYSLETLAGSFVASIELQSAAGKAHSHLQDLTVGWLKMQGVCQALKGQNAALVIEVSELKVEKGDRERLGAIRSSAMFKESLAKENGSSLTDGPPHSHHHHTTSSASSCTSCAKEHYQGRCIHKTALADHVIDQTFDSHKELLRKRLQEAEEELQGFRSGELFKAMQITINEEKTKSSTLEKELAALKLKMVDMTISRMQARTEATAAAPASNGTLAVSRGPDPLRMLKEENQQLSLQRKAELARLEMNLSYQAALFEAFTVGYSLKLDSIIAEGLPLLVRTAAAGSTCGDSERGGSSQFRTMGGMGRRSIPNRERLSGTGGGTQQQHRFVQIKGSETSAVVETRTPTPPSSVVAVAPGVVKQGRRQGQTLNMASGACGIRPHEE